MRAGLGRVVVLAAVGASMLLTPAVAPAAPSARRLPPSERDTVAAIFDPELAELGLRTTRARLQNARTYELDPRGRHLAVYVEPLDASFSDADYVATVTELAAVYLPKVFKRWKGLKSFDVCIERRDDRRAEPPAVVQVAVTRRGSREVRWGEVTLVELLIRTEQYAADSHPRHLYLYFESSLDDQPELVAARAAAQAWGSPPG